MNLEPQEVNPDIANRQRRRTDINRQWIWSQQPWKAAVVHAFYDWVVNKACDLDMEIRKAQRQHDEIALLLMQKMRFPGEYSGSWPSQIHNNTVFRAGTETLLTDYELLGQRLRVMRHVERLLEPLNFASAFNDGVIVGGNALPEGDWVTLTFFEEFLKDGWGEFHDRRRA